ncbi:zinc-dependent metalloprotease family protein [Zooshikella ganghwensis]|uniref:CBM-cenC domain-containing protein n=1 Tax=Zooshikella ganghwensis TaxID=202772 RepID=A0A4P9VS34_9GAMM|nr:zinc-dependent metalloprotease family protein [Zooshikella ganghwensis]RDH44992.1 hypothetical protein B9G39_16975 [Zooshikella ganghwensis]
MSQNKTSFPKKTRQILSVAISASVLSMHSLAGMGQTQPEVVDLMILYTEGAKSTADSYANNAGINKRITDLVEQLNELYRINNANIQLNLVHSELTADADTKRLDKITVGSHSVSIVSSNRGIRDLRAQYGADLVLTLVSVPEAVYDGTCGIATTSGAKVQEGQFSLSDRDNAYSVASIDKNTCDTYSHKKDKTLFDEVVLVVAHEFGHSMGLNHDVRTEKNNFNVSINDNAMKSFLKEALLEVKSDEYLKKNGKLPKKGSIVINDPTFDDYKLIAGGLYEYSFGYGEDDLFTTIMGYTDSYDTENKNWLPYFSTQNPVTYTFPFFRLDRTELDKPGADWSKISWLREDCSSSTCDYNLIPGKYPTTKVIKQLTSIGNADKNTLKAVNQASKQISEFCVSKDQTSQYPYTEPKAVKVKGMTLREFSLIHAYTINFNKTPFWSKEYPKSTEGFYGWQSEILDIIDIDAKKRYMTVSTVDNTMPVVGLDLTCALQQNETYRFAAEVQGGSEGVAAIWLYYETAQDTQDWILIDYKPVNQVDWTALTGDIRMPSQLTNARLVITGVSDGVGFSLNELKVLTKRN